MGDEQAESAFEKKNEGGGNFQEEGKGTEVKDVVGSGGTPTEANGRKIGSEGMAFCLRCWVCICVHLYHSCRCD